MNPKVRSISQMILIMYLLMIFLCYHVIFYKYLITWKRANKSIKFIIAGDFQQLLPVNDIVDTDFDYKHSPALHELSDGNRLQLTNCRRSDRYLF